MRWRIRTLPEQPVGSDAGLHPILGRILADRGLTDPDELRRFLHPDFDEHLHDPFLFRHMRTAVDRVSRAIDGHEPIVVYGDYDADGVCGAALLVSVLRQLGASVTAYLPHREREGYGMNRDAVELFATQGTRLVITVDCGSSNVEEIALANQRGIDVIVTDHHQQPQRIPDAVAILNPAFADETYPFPFLSGAGVAYKLVLALKRTREHTLHPQEEKWWLDLVAISTVADIVPLIGENRVLVHYGLQVIGKSRRPGLRALLRTLNGRKVSTSTIAFQLAPRINAAGRLDHADVAYRLLTTEDEQEATDLVGQLERLNRERQQITERIEREAREQLGDVTPETRLLAAYREDWPPGVVGIVAGHLANRYTRPAIIMGRVGDEIIGSGRSIPGFNITDALHAVSDHLSRYGGHAQACGFSLRDAAQVDAFLAAFHAVVAERLGDDLLETTLDIDAELGPDDLTMDFADAVHRLAPYGERMPVPIFASRALPIGGVRTVGQDGRHLQLFVRTQSGRSLKFIGFGKGRLAQSLKPGDTVDVAYEIEINEWNGSREPQLRIRDTRTPDV